MSRVSPFLLNGRGGRWTARPPALQRCTVREARRRGKLLQGVAKGKNPTDEFFTNDFVKKVHLPDEIPPPPNREKK
jgi:hypothetical protein